MQPVRRSPWYRSLPFVIVLLVCCWPAGILLMWLGAPWSRRTKTIITAIVVPLGLLVMALSQRGQPSSVSVPPTTAPIVALTQAPTTAPPTVAQPTEPPRPTVAVGNSTPLPTARPVFTVTPVPTSAPLPTTYEWIGSKQTSLPSRPRFSADVVVPSEYGDEQMAAVFRDAVNRAFRENRTAKAVVVFAYSSRDGINQGADKGRALASSDRLGWTGDGPFSTFLPPPARDQGRIYLTLGSMLGDTRQTSIER